MVKANPGGGGGGGGGPFFPGPLLSGVAGNNDDTLARAPVAGAMIYGNATPLWDRLAIGTAGQAMLVASGLPSWGTLGVAGGGTSFSTFSTGDVLYASAPNTLAKRAIGATGDVFQVGGGGVPVWAPVSGANFASQTANTFLAAPDGSSGVPSFRTIATNDLPSPRIDAHADGATITITASSSFGPGQLGYVTVTIDGNRTLSFTGGTQGQRVEVWVTQGAGAPRTLTPDGSILSGTTPALVAGAFPLSTVAGKVDILSFECVTSGTWRWVGFAAGFSS